MNHSRIRRSLAVGASALAAGAIAFTVAPSASAAEDTSDADSATSMPGGKGPMGGHRGPGSTGMDGAGRAAGGDERGPAADAPYIGARMVVTKDGATVAHVEDGSPADEAGLDEGDVVETIGDVAIDHRGALREALAGAEAGDEITVVVDHNGKQETIVITLGAAEDRPAPPAPEDVPWVGARLVHVEGGDGVLVRSVAADGPADTAGLEAGDVVTSIDGDSVTDWWQAREMLRDYAPGDTVKIVVDRSGESMTLSVTLGSLDDAVVRSFENGNQPPEGHDGQGEPEGGRGGFGRSVEGSAGVSTGTAAGSAVADVMVPSDLVES